MVRGKKLVGKELLAVLDNVFRDPRNYRPHFREISAKLGINESTVYKHFTNTFDSVRDGFIFNQLVFVVDAKELSTFVETMVANKHRILSVGVVSTQKFGVTVLFLSSTNN